MPQSIGAGNIYNISAITRSEKITYHTEELIRLSADLLGSRRFVRNSDALYCSAVESLERTVS